MRLEVSTIGGCDSRKKAISTKDLTLFMSAVVGKSLEIDATPSMLISELCAEVRRVAGINPEIPITSSQVIKGKFPVSGKTVGECGLTDGASITIKFIHTTA